MLEKYEAQGILEKNKLIPGLVSRKILTAIIKNEIIDTAFYKDFISSVELEQLRQRYNEKKHELNVTNKEHPKYLPFYYLIREKLPSVKWEIVLNQAGKPIVKFSAPRVGNLRPSLLSLLLERVSEEADSILNRKYQCTRILSNMKIKALSDFMEKAKAIYPDETGMQLIVNWISTALNGEESTIFTPVCPDYSVEPSGNPECPFRHTFDSLGSGIDPVGLKILDILPSLQTLLMQLEIKPQIIFSMADFEAFSEKKLKRLGVNEGEFLRRVELTRSSLMEKAGRSFFMTTTLFGGRDAWLHKLKQIENKLQTHHFGLTTLTHEKLLHIADKRRALYTRFYGENESLEEYLPIVLEQGAEYATMGAFISKYYKNCLILGADNHLFAPFYSFSKSIPTLYLKRYYS